MRKRLTAVVEVLKWAEPYAWEDEEDDDGQPSLVFSSRAVASADGCPC